MSGLQDAAQMSAEEQSARDYKSRLEVALNGKRERVVEKRPREDHNEEEDSTLSDNLGIVNPPTDSAEEDAAKWEKLDRAAKLHTLCFHSHFFKGEVLEELWPQATYGNCISRRRGRQLFMGNVKRFKNEVIGPEGTILKYMDELMKNHPIIASENTPISALAAHLKMEFSYTDFLQVFKYLKDLLDWEKTPKEGKAYCRSLFINLAVQAKQQIHKDAAAKARGDVASREFLIRFWDVFPIKESHLGIGKHSFAIRNDMGKGQRHFHKPKNYSGQLDAMIDLDDDGL